MLITLNKKKFLEVLSSFDDMEKAGVEGMSDEELDCMVRLLKAEKESDICDISTETVMKMFEYIPEFIHSLAISTIFSNTGSSTGSFEAKLLSLPSVKSKRRVI